MSKKENLAEVLALRELGYSPTAIGNHLGMKKATVSVMLTDYALKRKTTFPPMHKRKVSCETATVGNRVEFSFQEGKYQHLTGIIQKVNASSYIVKLDDIHVRRIRLEKWWIEGNGCVCVSMAKCKKVAL